MWNVQPSQVRRNGREYVGVECNAIVKPGGKGGSTLRTHGTNLKNKTILEACEKPMGVIPLAVMACLLERSILGIKMESLRIRGVK